MVLRTRETTLIIFYGSTALILCCSRLSIKFCSTSPGALGCSLCRRTSPGSGRWGRQQWTGGTWIPPSQYIVMTVALYISSQPSGRLGSSCLTLWACVMLNPMTNAGRMILGQ